VSADDRDRERPPWIRDPVRVACVGLGWWSDVLAAAIARSGRLRVVACHSRTAAKRDAFAARYHCRVAARYDDVLRDPEVEAIINTTPNAAHLATTAAAATAGKHVFLDKPIANTLDDAQVITQCCAAAGVVLAVGYQRRREGQFRWMRRQIEAGALGRLVNAEANISRDRLGQIDLSSWRYTAEGMPGGVMLQIGIHYTDVLAYLLGPIRAVNAQLAQLVLPGDNPDVASLILEHESGALATLNASYASAAEHYVMNVYGKEATAYYDLQQGLRWHRRGQPRAEPVSHDSVDALVDELDEFAGAVRGLCTPEVGGEQAAASLAVILAGLISAREKRRVEIAEIWSPSAERG
jgi:predicted dehydrogenase